MEGNVENVLVEIHDLLAVWAALDGVRDSLGAVERSTMENYLVQKAREVIANRPVPDAR